MEEYVGKLFDSIKNFLLLFFLIICFIALGMSFKILRLDSEISNISKGNIYIQLQHESNPISIDKHQYQKILEKLYENNLFTYYEIYEQPIDVEKKTIDDLLKLDYISYDERLQSVQIGQNVIEDFDFKLENGRLFTNDDYILNDRKDIPIILGSAYNEVWNIGTRFIGNYLYDTYSFYVVGILEKETEIDISTKHFLLDNYIIMPSFSVVNELTEGLKIHYANKTSGMIKSLYGNEGSIFKYLEKNIDDNEAGIYSFYSSSLKSNFKTLFYLDLNFFIVFFIIMSIIIVFIYFNFLKKLIIKRKSYMSVQILSLIVAVFLNFFVARAVVYLIGIKLNYFIPIVAVITIMILLNIIINNLENKYNK